MSGIVAQNVGRRSGLIKTVAAGGEWTLISTLTSDGSDADLSFTSGIDSTYDEYCFKFINIHAESTNVHFGVGFRDGSSAFDASKTTTTFYARHKEDDGGTSFGYDASRDQANGTGYQDIYYDTGANANDECGSGTLFLFLPSSTTFVKHFFATTNHMVNNSQCSNNYIGGYFNTTSAIDEIQFKFISGDIDAGTVKLYGIA